MKHPSFAHLPRTLALTAVVTVLTLLLSAASLAAERVNIGYVLVMDDAQVLVAEEAGFYDAQGLDANLVMFGSGTDLIKGIVTGQLDVGVLGFTNALSWVARGADLKIVGGAQMGYHSILAREDAGIKSVADLKGRTLASQKQGSTADIVLTGVVLQRSGLSKQDLNMVYTSPATAVQSLVSGRVDAAFLFEPYDRIARLTAPVEEIYEIGKVWPFPCMVVITSADAVAEKREVINKVLEAQRQAIEFMSTEPRRAAEYLAPYFIPQAELQTPDGPVSAVDVTFEALKTQAFRWDLAEAEIDRMKEVAEMMEAQGALQSAVDVDRVLDLSWQSASGR